ncbi:NAD-dependent DNA ligase LigA [Mycoplasmoides genitalium]
MDVKLKIQQLVNLIKNYDYHYYVLSEPLIDDFEYDMLYKSLQQLEKDHPDLIQIDSPTQRVGGEAVKGFKKLNHNSPMLSLENAFSTKEIANFIDNINFQTNSKNEFVVEPKIDGVSISLTYKNGVLVHALTRGDGSVGEDVLNNVKTIKSIPLTIPFTKTIEIRGEIFVDKKTFLAINNQLEKPFANARNLAAGTIRNLNSEITAQRKLRALFYYIPNGLEESITTQTMVLEQLKQWKFPVSDTIRVFQNKFQLINYLEAFDKKRKQLTFNLDGLVIKLNSLLFYQQLGATSKSPRWAIAFKFSPKFVQTKLTAVLITIGRTGRVNYTAKLESVNLDGTKVTAATLHNFDYIKTKDIRINDTVVIYKAGEIIPKVLKVNLEKRKNDTIIIQEQKYCPSCNSKLVKIVDEVDQYCTNETCKERNIQLINYFVSKTAMDINGLNINTITKLYEHNLVRSIVDLYDLKDKKNQVLKLDLKIGDKLFNKLVDNIENSKQKGMARLLTGLGIKHVGNVLAKNLANHFKNIKALQHASLENLISLNDVGITVAESLYNWFHDPNHLQLIEQLELRQVKTDQLPLKINFETNNIYFQKRFLITGSFNISRDQIKDLLSAKFDCQFASEVKPTVDFVIAGNKPTLRKINHAKELNIPIINEAIWT